MIDMQAITQQLSADSDAIRALVQSVSTGQARWKPAPDAWSMQAVMEHVYNEERLDFRKHLREMLNDPTAPWSEFPHAEYIPVSNCQQALEGFLQERKASLDWLAALGSPDWAITSSAPWGVISAGDVLVSWVAHDFLHLRQMIELGYAWNEAQASPCSVQYAGGW